MNKAKYFILGVFLFSIILIGLIPFVKSDIENSDKFIFKENELYNEVSQNGINPDYSYNLRNKDYYNENYFGTFSFDDDIGKENEMIPFISNIPNSASAIVLESFDNHDSVLELNTSIVDENVYCNFDFYDLEGNIEFWIQTNNTDKTKGFALYDDNTRIIQCYFHSNGNFQYLDGVTLTDTNYDYFANNWTHIRIHWQADNDFDWYVGGRLILNNGNNYANQIHGINRIMFYNSDDSIYYIDAFGIDDAVYDGIPYYNVDDNLMPEKINTNDLEIDKFEFDYTNEQFRNNETIFNYTENYDNNIKINHISDIDNRIRWSSLPTGIQHNDYIYLNDINRTDSQFNISTTLTLELWKVNEQFLNIEIFMYDFDMVSHLVYTVIVQWTGGIRVYDYADNTPDSTATSIIYSEGDTLNLNIYFNTDDNIAILNADGSIHHWNLMKGYFGLQSLRYSMVKTNANSYESILDIHNLGVYFNGSSLVSDFNSNISNEVQQSGYSLYQLSLDSSTDIKRCYLLDYEIFENETTVYNYNDYENYKDTLNLFERNNYSIEVNYNLINNWSYLYSFLIFEYFINVSYPKYINSEGIKLESNIYKDNELSIETYYISEYYYINTDSENNYFYSIDNKLYYNFNRTNSDKNYMSITFEIDSYLIDSDYGVYFNSYITKNYTGTLLFDYNTGSNSYFTLNKSDSLKYSEYNLTNQNGYFLENIEIIISNDDITNVSGFTNGYLDSINLGNQYYFVDLDNLDDSLLDLDFTEAIIYVIIILIMFIIPCYLVYEKLGKKVVIPMFLLIVLVLMISSFLPIWLGIIMLFSGLFFIYHQSKGEVSND